MYTFEYLYENPDDDADTQAVSHTVNGEADLTELLTALTFFLRAAGFDYVTQLVAVKDDGDTTTGQ